MAEKNTTVASIWDNKTLIIAAIVVVLIVIFMYFYDQKQQRAYELRRLERRVELLEDWGIQRSNTPPLGSSNRFNNKQLRSRQQSERTF